MFLWALASSKSNHNFSKFFALGIFSVDSPQAVMEAGLTCVESEDDREQDLLDVVCKHGFIQYLVGDKQLGQLNVILTNLEARINWSATDQKLILHFTGSIHPAYFIKLHCISKNSEPLFQRKNYSLKNANKENKTIWKNKPFNAYCLNTAKGSLTNVVLLGQRNDGNQPW